MSAARGNERSSRTMKHSGLAPVMSYKTKNNLTVDFQMFDSARVFVDVTSTIPVNSAWRGKSQESEKQGDAGWYGTSSYEGAVSLFHKGWNDPLEKIRAAVRGRVRQAISDLTHRPKIVNAVAGHTPAVPRAIIGLPNSMYATKHKPAKEKTVHIIYDIGANGSTSASDLERSAITVAAMVQIVEQSGYRVKLDITTLGTMSRSGKNYHAPLVTLKDYRQPLNMTKICFPLVHTAMFRRIFFKWIETSEIIPCYNSGYGYPISNNKNEVSDLREELKKDRAYYVNYADSVAAGFEVAPLMERIGIVIGGNK